MAYKAIYRKWRPVTFDDVIGQSHITETLKNQIKTDRVGHAYLFCGTRGTGKTTAAKIFARAVNCPNNKDGNPCNECEICKGILSGSIMDVTEIDAASNNGVDSIRELRDDTKYVTASAKYRIYIIDEVHMLSSSAFNALLKTLEEPPEHVIFILATTEPQKVPQTILSRCQRYDFRRIKPADIVLRLKEIAYGEGLKITDEAYNLIARLGDGSMRDAISVLERVVSAKGSELTYEAIVDTLGIVPLDTEFEMAAALINSDSDKIFSLIGDVMDAGRDLNVFVDNLTAHFRNLLVCKAVKDPSRLLDYSADEIVRFEKMAEGCTYEKISYIISSLADAKEKAKWVKAPRVIYETALIKMCTPELDTSNEAVIARLGDIEEKIKSGTLSVAAVGSSEAEPEAKKKQKKKKVPTKLYNPIAPSELNNSNPLIVCAKKWDKIASSVVKAAPHLAMAVMGKQITVDKDGFIIVYDRSTQMGDKNIAENQINLISELVRKSTGLDICVKAAFKDEIDDYIIDIWSLPGEEESPSDTDSKEPSAEEAAAEERSEVSESYAHEGSSDPLDDVMASMDNFVDKVDERDFLDFKREENTFSQSSFDDDDENDEEEFLEENDFSDRKD